MVRTGLEPGAERRNMGSEQADFRSRISSHSQTSLVLSCLSITTSTLHVPLLESSRQQSPPFVDTETFASFFFEDAQSLAESKFFGCSQVAVRLVCRRQAACFLS
jgi:hypothetical protein